MIGRWLDRVTGGGPVYALLILFGLNAVDELDRTAFGILVPEIRDHFDLDLHAMLTVIALVYVAAFALQVPIAVLADRSSRVRLAWLGAASWGVFSLLTGFATSVLVLAFVRSGSAIGRAVVDPTHNALLADYYPPDVRPRVFSFHRAANAVGSFVGPLVAGLLAHAYGWRTPFIVFAIPTFVFVVLALRLREPIRGAHERMAVGASEDAVATEEDPPSFAEGWRIVWRIQSLRRIWYSLPFLAAALIGFVTLAALLYEEAFDLDERARGLVIAAVEPAQLLGLVYGARSATRLLARGPGRVLSFLSVVAFAVSALAVAFALAPNIGVAVAAHAAITAGLAVLTPGILASLAMAIPPRARSLGFSVGALWVIPGLVILPLIGAIADRFGIRPGMLLMTPVFLVGGLVIASAGSVIGDDVTQVWRTAAARSEVLYERRRGRAPLLLVRGLDVAYDGVQVLFGVDLDIDEGEVVALLGTNGAGKSTLLKAICGVVDADRGAVIFDGREITHAPPYEIAGRGITLLPGGAGTFPSLSVAENLELAGWLDRRAAAAGIERALALFPELRQRVATPAADLSGGQQQMLALGMALVARPRMLLIDELTLGLAPAVVERLLPVVREVAAGGTTVVLVEQSVNLALTVATRAYFMEKGEIRFRGPAAELLDRPDVLRAVFLSKGGGGADASSAAKPPAGSLVGASPALETVGLIRRFGGVVALDEVSLRVMPGEIVGIIGPNGAGKTTLFDVVTGLLPPDRGRIVLGGVDVTAMPAHGRARRGMGRSFQDGRLFPALTVEEVLAVALERWLDVRDPFTAALHLPAWFDSEERVRARVTELLDLLGIASFRTTFVRELSTGTRRIVDLACVVARRPTVVLLDEPSSGIAQREAEALGALLLDLRRGLGASLVIIEHDIPLVASVADRLVAMDQGAILADGDPTSVLDDPGVVAAYLGGSRDVIARSGPIPP